MSGYTLHKTGVHLALRKRLQSCLAMLAGFVLAQSALANPVLNNVASGNVTIQPTPTTTQVNQTSGKAILNWQSFNIQQNEATHFYQPAHGVALNRISPNQGASQIFGSLTATGTIILINQAGIYFGPSSVVNVGSIMATTSDMTNAN